MYECGISLELGPIYNGTVPFGALFEMAHLLFYLYKVLMWPYLPPT